jgi:dTDP-4-dehydrorhamnose reductase
MANSILGTGLQGLVGSKLTATFSDRYIFDNLDISHPVTPVDITDETSVRIAVEASPAEVIMHFAAFTDVTKAWEQSGDKSGPAYKVNVLGTQHLVKAAAETGKHLIHISTAYVFDGTTPGLYTETDTPNPIEWYGQTKLWAEEAVQASSGHWTILRIDQPFRSDSFAKPDAVRKLANLMRSQPPKPIFTNHWCGPTFIDDFVKVIEWAARTRTTGLFHASSGEKWSDFELAQELAKSFGLTAPTAGDLTEYLKTTNRPYQPNTALDCSKLISQLDFPLTPIKEALTTCQEL